MLRRRHSDNHVDRMGSAAVLDADLQRIFSGLGTQKTLPQFGPLGYALYRGMAFRTGQLLAVGCACSRTTGSERSNELAPTIEPKVQPTLGWAKKTERPTS